MRTGLVLIIRPQLRRGEPWVGFAREFRASFASAPSLAKLCDEVDSFVTAKQLELASQAAPFTRAPAFGTHSRDCRYVTLESD